MVHLKKVSWQNNSWTTVSASSELQIFNYLILWSSKSDIIDSKVTVSNEKCYNSG